MVLNSLASSLQSSLSNLLRSPQIDLKSLDASLKEISTALLQSDVNVKLVANLRKRVRDKVVPVLDEVNKERERGEKGTKLGVQGVERVKRTTQKAIFEELVGLVDPTGGSDHAEQNETTGKGGKGKGKARGGGGRGDAQTTTGPYAGEVWKPKKGQSNVIMMVGLQGSGKTTTCTKLAVHYQRRGYKVALVCADTFRAGAFDQLKQNATKAKVPFYGSYTILDPLQISLSGCQKFRQEKFDIIILDTSGRHRQESELFEEMKGIKEGVKPEWTILVLDGAIGQAAESQSKAFKEAAGFGGIIVTKMDGHAKGGGAISAVAATSTPIQFLGVGEHLHDLERFSPSPFISRLLGMGDLQGLMEQAQTMMGGQNKDGAGNMMKKVMEKGEFSLRDMKEQMGSVMNMGPFSKITSMIPGMSNLFGAAGGSDEEASSRMRRLMYIFDSMTDTELDSDGRIFVTPKEKKLDQHLLDEDEKPNMVGEGRARRPNWRVKRVARGSGTSVREVEEMLAQHKMFAEMVKKAGGKKGWLQAAQKMQGQQGGHGRGRGGQPNMSPQQLAQMQKMLPPGMREQLKAAGGMAGVQKMMEQMGMGGGPGGGGGGMGGLPGLGGLGGLPGMGGMGGGMPDMGQMQKMMEQMGMGGMGGMPGMGGGAGGSRR